MREIGASDAFIYMTNTGKGNTMEIQLDMKFAQPADTEILQQAADRALALFPEFSAALVIHNGRLMYQEDSEPVRIIETDSIPDLTVDYCTEDTNGHVFYLSVNKNDRRQVTLSSMHGMSDFAGCMMLLKTILYEYKRGLCPQFGVSEQELAAAGIRTQIPKDWNRAENLDAYSICGTPQASKDAESVPETPFIVSDLTLYEPDADINHVWHIGTDTGAFLDLCRKFQTSFAPLIIDILLNATAECYGAGDETVISGLPVDLRSVFGVYPVTNFSDSVLLWLTAEERRLPIEERCALLKQSLKKQHTAQHMGPAVYGKNLAARGMLDDPSGFIETAKRIMEPVLTKAKRKSPFTFMATYPGKMDLPPFLEDLVTDMLPAAVMGRVKFYFTVTTFGRKMTFQVAARNDDERLPKMLAEKLEQLGLKCTLADRGLRHQGCLRPEKLRNVK